MLMDGAQRNLAKLLTQTNNLTVQDVDGITIEVLIENGVALLFLEQVKNHNKHLLQHPLIARLQQFSKQLQIIHALQYNAFKQVFKVLNDNGIAFIVLKGWALSYACYKQPYHRPKTDIDILITDSNKEKVKTLLAGLGYTNPRGWEPAAIIDQYSMRKALVEGIYANIDVHLELTNDKVLQPLFNWSGLYSSSTINNNLDCRILSKPYALIHAIVHLLYHACDGDFIKLIWFYDLHLLVEQLNQQEQSALLKTVADMGISNEITYALEGLNELFSSSNTTNLINKMHDLPTNKKYVYLTRSPSRLKVILRNFKETKGLRLKLKVITETFFPPKEEIYLKYGKDTKWPLPFLYTKRIIKGFLKAAKRAN